MVVVAAVTTTIIVCINIFTQVLHIIKKLVARVLV